jgi:hypothetical protein
MKQLGAYLKDKIKAELERLGTVEETDTTDFLKKTETQNDPQ